MGAAYVDVLLADGPVRFSVVPRRALAHRFVRDALCESHRLALLAGQHVQPALELAESIARRLEACVARPFIDLVSEHPEVVGEMRRLLDRLLEGRVAIRDLPHASVVDSMLEPA